jgi:hypothetical protein
MCLSRTLRHLSAAQTDLCASQSASFLRMSPALSGHQLRHLARQLKPSASALQQPMAHLTMQKGIRACEIHLRVHKFSLEQIAG